MKCQNKTGGQQRDDYFKKGRYKKVIPVIYIRAALEVMLSIKNQKEIVNDHLDMMRLNSTLPLDDILLTDKSNAYDIKQAQLDNYFNTKVYSGTENDIESLKNNIQEIIF